MASWKKVVVSGSAISQLNNDANYVAQNDSSVSLSGSFSGSFFGDGSGLSGVAASFPVSTATANDSLKYFVNDGASKYITGTSLSNYVYGKVSGDLTIANGGAATLKSGIVSGSSQIVLQSADKTGFTGATSITTLGTIGTGTWQGTAIADDYISSATTWNNKLDSSGTIATNDYAKFDASGDLVGRSYSEVKTDLSLNNVENTALSTWPGTTNITTLGTIGTGTWQGTAIADAYIASAATWNAKQDALTFGIADTNAVQIDDADVANGDYAKFTASGLQGRSTSEVKSDLSLNNVENTALSTWPGTTNITTLGTITTGTWNGGVIADAYLSANTAHLSGAQTFTGAKTFSANTVFEGDITVQGTASFQETTNLTVADKFVLLNSGSSTDNSPGGIVVQQDTQDVGVALAYDAAAGSNSGRWGTKDGQDASTSTFTADAYVSYVVDVDAGQSDIALYQQNGNIKVDSGEIWIYS